MARPVKARSDRVRKENFDEEIWSRTASCFYSRWICVIGIVCEALPRA